VLLVLAVRSVVTLQADKRKADEKLPVCRNPKVPCHLDKLDLRAPHDPALTRQQFQVTPDTRCDVSKSTCEAKSAVPLGQRAALGPQLGATHDRQTVAC
jgi:hypothetical protein